MRAFKKGEPFMGVKDASGRHPVFSEGFLYPKMAKDDARFILGVVEEYDALIKKLGSEKLYNLLTGDRRR